MTPTPQDRARRIAAAAIDLKAENVRALDVEALTSFADAFVLASGTSDRHVRAIADAIREAAKASGSVLGVEGHDEGRWVLLDLGDVVAHVFQVEVREHYDFDRLWGDAVAIDLPDPASPAERQTAP